jgi:uncharacterized membrane protein
LAKVEKDLNAEIGVRETSAPTAPAPAEKSSGGERRRIVVITVALLAYAALSQYSASPANSHAKTIGALLSVVPVLLIAVALVWWWSWRLTALLIAALSGVLLYRNWPLIERNYEWADLIQQFAIYGLVTLVFVRSLFANRIPLCALLAQQMYGELTAHENSYMRWATVAWAAFYGLMTAAVLGLFFAASRRDWSFFVNFTAWGLMVLAGFIDHALRRRLLPRHREGGILALIRRSLAG